LIEFAVYRPFDPKAESNSEAYKEPHYIAYVMHQKGEVRWHDLGDAREIDQSVDALRQALRDPLRRDVRNRARAVDEKVMQPVRALIGDANQLLISPDGALNLIPFETLVDERGRYLIQHYSFTYLTSGRDLLRLQVARKMQNSSLVIADPLFGEPELPQPAIVGYVNAHSRAKNRDDITSVTDLSSVYFAPLIGTAQEARTIKSLFPESNTLLRQQATESALKQVSAPRLLHIATHGFFLTNGLAASAAGTNIQSTRAISASAKVANPLLRSGLALAGANLHKNGDDDGILTAMEASGLNLWGTKLVTLSACDTGLGEVKNGEGVYGLRRAFVLAGTESLVMSLWPVSDYVTREMMTAYYTGLREGQGRNAALRQVQLSMLKRKEREHPFYWASFIQSGEWANLDGKR
ncbi:MAG TPA: CHAT domain-containing protein, partial [Blastocatellia bacterium]|nr:CHAT domain-containing protein [Blastocatellia bacterium]